MTSAPAGTLRSAARFVASGFGSGYAPVASGTVTSALALAVGLVLMHLSPWLLAAAALVSVVGGWWAIELAAVEGDPGWVTIDEVAGQWITLLGLTELSFMGVLAAFVLFRVLDITKPGPIGWADRWKSPAGVMADDVLAGVIGAVVLRVAVYAGGGL